MLVQRQSDSSTKIARPPLQKPTNQFSCKTRQIVPKEPQNSPEKIVNFSGKPHDFLKKICDPSRKSFQ